VSAPEERQPQQDLRGRQGFRWEGDDAEALRTVLEAAFDYRGDVTLRLRDGGELTGYLSNRDQEAPEPYVMLLPADGGPRQRVLYSAICGVAFTGRDTAEGKPRRGAKGSRRSTSSPSRWIDRRDLTGCPAPLLPVAIEAAPGMAAAARAFLQTAHRGLELHVSCSRTARSRACFRSPGHLLEVCDCRKKN
jgi:hypothetical protein